MVYPSISDAIYCFARSIRIIYIAGAVFFVGYTYYTVILLAKTQNLNVKDEVSIQSKYLYPSITFCYVYKVKKCNFCNDVNNGRKHIWWVYYLHYVEAWKKSGKKNEYLQLQ